MVHCSPPELVGRAIIGLWGFVVTVGNGVVSDVAVAVAFDVAVVFDFDFDFDFDFAFDFDLPPHL
jgi:hypothetical protein